jgi:hypothetical protein
LPRKWRVPAGWANYIPCVPIRPVVVRILPRRGFLLNQNRLKMKWIGICGLVRVHGDLTTAVILTAAGMDVTISIPVA